MVLISKHHFDPSWTTLPCNVVVHPWTNNCLKAAPTVYAMALLGSAKFYLLIYLIQIVRSNKMTKKEQWIKIFKNYLRSIVTGMLVSGTGFQLICLFRSLLGKFTYYSLMMIPFTVSGLFLYLETPSRRRWVINSFYNMLIEYYLRNLERAGYFSISKTKQVLMFMLGNSLLLYLMRLEKGKEENSSLFWLFTPEKVKKKSYECTNVCPHEGDCKKYILKSASSYFGIALAISMAKVIVPQIRTPISAISSIRPRHLRLALFLSSYIGIYKAIICYLCRKNGFDSALYALPAGCIAGLSFASCPNLGLTIAPFIAALKFYSTTLCQKKILPSNIHLTMAMFCLCQGALLNGAVLNSDVCPIYIFHIMNTITNGLATFMSGNFYDIIKKNVAI